MMTCGNAVQDRVIRPLVKKHVSRANRSAPKARSSPDDTKRLQRRANDAERWMTEVQGIQGDLENAR